MLRNTVTAFVIKYSLLYEKMRTRHLTQVEYNDVVAAGGVVAPSGSMGCMGCYSITDIQPDSVRLPTLSICWYLFILLGRKRYCLNKIHGP